jgi:hypothetical protein|nr:MAG TPA: baseplate protein [Caudoviricetes sp.]
MGTITAYGSKHSHEFKLTVNETSTSTANNTSEISFSFTIYKASYSWSNWKSITYSISINGTSYSGTIPSYSAGSTLTIRTGSQTVSHNSDGTKSINYSFSVNDGSGQSYTCGNASASGSMNLSTIPRYAKASISLNSKTVNSVKLNYSADATIDGIWVSKNGGAWESGYALTSPINVSGLSPNTKYTLKIRVKRADSQLYSESNSIEVTTHQIATLSSVPNVNIGSAHTITWANPSGASTSLKLCKTDNSVIIDYGTVTGTSKAITPTASKIYPLTPNSNTYKARYILTTTANGKSYTNSKDFTFTVTNSNPTFNNFTYQDTNTTITALTGNNQILVNGYSNVKATISTANKATAKNSATMKSYKLLIGTKNTTANYNASADVNMSINQVNNNVIDLYAIDSRGNSTKVSKTATIKKYSNIKIKSLSATRQNNIGTITTLNFEGEFWNASFGSVANAITSCKYKYKTTSSSTWIDGKTTLTYTISGNKITGSLNIQGDAGTDGFSVANSFDIQLILADKLSSATYNIILSSGNPALAIYKNNVAIGQQYNTSEGSKLQVNGKINATGLGTNLASAIVNKIYPVGSIYMSVSSTEPSVLFGGTWERMKGGFLYGAVNSVSNSSITGTSTGASSGSTGGPSTNVTGSTTLTIDQIPAHSHTTFKKIGGVYAAGTNRGGVDTNNTQSTGTTGGGKGHTHTLSNHTHSLNSHTHAIPYMAVFVWKRTK